MKTLSESFVVAFIEMMANAITLHQQQVEEASVDRQRQTVICEPHRDEPV